MIPWELLAEILIIHLTYWCKQWRHPKTCGCAWFYVFMCQHSSPYRVTTVFHSHTISPMSVSFNSFRRKQYFMFEFTMLTLASMCVHSGVRILTAIKVTISLDPSKEALTAQEFVLVCEVSLFWMSGLSQTTSWIVVNLSLSLSVSLGFPCERRPLRGGPEPDPSARLSSVCPHPTSDMEEWNRFTLRALRLSNHGSVKLTLLNFLQFCKQSTMFHQSLRELICGCYLLDCPKSPYKIVRKRQTLNVGLSKDWEESWFCYKLNITTLHLFSLSSSVQSMLGTRSPLPNF